MSSQALPKLVPPASPIARSFDLRLFDHVFQTLIANGGPQPSEYSAVSRTIRQLGDAVRAHLLPAGMVLDYVREITQRHFQGTMQAEALTKKFGYSGDFQIIDHIYTQRINPAPDLRAWDYYFHSQAAPHAVRNRKDYFLRLVQTHLAAKNILSPLCVLNVASGPARDLYDFFLNNPGANVQVDCVDAEKEAVSFGEKLCTPWSERIRFHHRNVLRHLPLGRYDLVWSAGLFDYLSDRIFVRLLRSLLNVTRPGGEVVVGNFSDYNPSRDYMELLGDWHLHHRSRSSLIDLAIAAGASASSVQVSWEPEGVNFFLHIRR